MIVHYNVTSVTNSVMGGTTVQIVPGAVTALPLTHTLLLNVNQNLIASSAGKLIHYVLDNIGGIVLSRTYFNWLILNSLA